MEFLEGWRADGARGGLNAQETPMESNFQTDSLGNASLLITVLPLTFYMGWNSIYQLASPSDTQSVKQIKKRKEKKCFHADLKHT